MKNFLVVLLTLFVAFLGFIPAANAQSVTPLSCIGEPTEVSLSANNQIGIYLQNDCSEFETVNINTAGQWTFGDVPQNFPPNTGDPNWSHDGLQDPNCNIAQLLVMVNNQSTDCYPTNNPYELDQGQSLQLLFNDLPGQYYNNKGTIIISAIARPGVGLTQD